jgi:DNA-binding HxlR family transcriptional regulator
MERLSQTPTICPVTVTASVLSNKWRPVIVKRLLDGSKRFSEIKRLIPGISSKVLSQNLAILETQGIVRRRIVSDTRPVLVLYELTPKGKALKGVLYEMEKWGLEWGTAH